MEYMSITFLMVFVPLVFAIYYFTKDKYRNTCLFFSSIIFYAWIEPVFVFLILFIILLVYITGLLMDFFKSTNVIKNIIFVLSIVSIVLLFIWFRYPQLLPTFLNNKLTNDVHVIKLIVPFGVSIYCMQSISYIVDLYLGIVKVQKNIINIGLYISFFPQLICGPIVRYTEMQSELSERTTTVAKTAKGFGMFIRGLSKVVILATPALSVWEEIKMQGEKMSMFTAWFGIIFFAYGIYFYFAGYSDMARGLAKIFGFEFPVNFNNPYHATSIVDFWRRWNITLTMWFKVYMIAHIKKRSQSFLVNMLKLMALWIMIALWYGFSFNLICWAFFMGGVVVLEKFFLSALLEKIPVIFQRFYTIIVVLIGWTIFANDSLSSSANYLRAMFKVGEMPIIDGSFAYYLLEYAVLLVLFVIVASPKNHTIGLKFELERPQLALVCKHIMQIALIVICMVIIVTNSSVVTI